MHIPPAPPECMGLEGEYDPQGLIKRAALALDQVPELADIDTLQLIQEGGTLILTGSVPDQDVLHRIIEVVQRVDGTKAVEATQVQLVS